MIRTSAKADRKRRLRLAHGEPFDSPRPWRMALSDPKRAHACERVEGESKGKTPAPGTEPCFVYILECADGSYYVGSTSNVAERERIHNEGHGAARTMAHGVSPLLQHQAMGVGLQHISGRPSRLSNGHLDLPRWASIHLNARQLLKWFNSILKEAEAHQAELFHARRLRRKKSEFTRELCLLKIFGTFEELPNANPNSTGVFVPLRRELVS